MSLHHLTYHCQYRFEAPCAAVFDAAIQPPEQAVDPHLPGGLLSTTPVWGSPGEAGYQVVARFSWGTVDLEMTETTLAADRPLKLTVAQRPNRFLPYNPAERLPPVDSDVPARLDRLFDKTYGNPPIITEITFDFSPLKGGTLVDLSITARTSTKPGWLKTRRWNKSVPEEAARILSRIEEALQVQ
ncbi:hypothetical protein AB3Y40_12285 [Yoonia sp. R2331]|uniref:hypothetical protein n=1 Tax=Yoonia sp. R2331 TaxID=3237238 RepID=UPI0034E48F3B